MERSAARNLAESTLLHYSRLNARQVEDLSPRVRMALRLYVHGAVKTQREAADAAGLNRAYFSSVANSPAGQKYMQSAHNIIEENANDVSTLMRRLSVRAIAVIGGLMEDGTKEETRLRAAQDLADRGPETAKIQKHQVESFTLGTADARAIAESMVAAASIRQRFASLENENFDRVDIEEAEVEQIATIPSLTLMEP